MDPSQVMSLAEARKRFFDGAALPPGSVQEPILLSWRRCLGLGLPVSGRGAEGLMHGELTPRLEANADWLALARPQIDTLFESVVDQGHVVIVADRSGVILEEIGHPAFLDRAERVALTPGMDWSERQRGTNAIGTALQLGQTVRVRGGEHYLERNRQLSCLASPIVDPYGRPVGVLDVSGLPRKLGPEIGARVEATARLIEQRLFERETRLAYQLLFHVDPAQLGTSRAGRLAFDDQERLLAADRIAMHALQLDWEALGQLSFAELFGETLAHWLARAGTHRGVLAWRDRLFSGRMIPPPPPLLSGTGATASPPRAAVAAPAYVPADDEGGLPTDLLPIGLKLLHADIPVLILGETGTGKDKFARTLHRYSVRADAPFVAVNCAAIPEGLIEAELFGYEEGAFTGARRQGSKGRLREAHGGVLFLDEIGDMPLSMQARLLRVLQERVVTPLGGGVQALDIRLLCATHRDLRTMVQTGSFRADLYYRLSHYPLALPPLRERGDVAALAQRLLDAGGAAARGIALAPELAAAFRRYPWPGNLRELSNLLQTLLALVDDRTVLSLAHLPSTLRQDMLGAAGQVPQTGQLRAMLAQCGGNASAAARALGISRSTFYRRLRAQGLDMAPAPPRP